MKKILTLVFAILFAQTAQAQVTFTDITQTAGVANVGRLGTNLAWGDYDGDGDPDLYITNWGSALGPTTAINRLYRNNGDGSFTDVAPSAGVSDGANKNSVDAQWIDYDNDGDLDLYVVEFGRQDQLYSNNGNGTFVNVTTRSGINVISQGDEQAAAWGDYDNDGLVDLYIGKLHFRNSLYHNNGDGSFSEVGVVSGVADIRDTHDATWGDYDNDGDVDLYVVNREQNNALYKNDGSSFFEEVACALSIDNTDVGRGGQWVDFDNDNDLDLFLANIGANALYRNDGADRFVNIASGAFKTVPGAWVSWMGAWADFDRDGDLDLFVANGADSRSGQVSPLLRNDGNGAFVNITSGSGINTGSGSAMAASTADMDGDGDLDLFVVNSRFTNSEACILYRNNTTP